MKPQNSPLGSGSAKILKSLFAAFGLAAAASATAAPIGQVGVFISGEEFGPGKEIHADSGAKQIAASPRYTYRLSGKIKSQPGTALGKALGSGVSLDAFLEGLKAGSSSKLGGTFDNPGSGLPVTVINQKFSGSKTFPGIGKLTISFTVTGKIDASGKCYVDVTGVKTVPKLTKKQKAAFGTIKFMKGAKLLFSSSPTVLFKKSNTVVSETAGTVTVPVWRDTNYHGAVTVDYATVDGTAAAGTDYVAKTGTISFADGETQKNITIDITDNALNDGVRRFTLQLSNPGGGAFLGATTSTTVTISDDE